MNSELAITLISLSLGSFGNSIISWLSGKAKFDLLVSKCFCGEKNLKIYELIPVISYILQFGKCSSCSKSIPMRYLLVELICLALALLLFIKFGFGYEFVFQFMVFFILLLIASIDYLTFTIPNSLVLILLSLGLVNFYFHPSSILTNLVSAFSVILLLLFLNRCVMIYKNEDGIGFGDIKLISALFIIFGLPVSIVGLWLSASIALIALFISRSIPIIRPIIINKVPFGLFLAIGYFISSQLTDSIIYNFQDLIGVIL